MVTNRCMTEAIIETGSCKPHHRTNGHWKGKRDKLKIENLDTHTILSSRRAKMGTRISLVKYYIGMLTPSAPGNKTHLIFLE